MLRPILSPSQLTVPRKNRIHAHAFLERVEHCVHAFVQEACGPDLDAYAPVAHG